MADRPDARLLLRADKVRRVPEGARVWHARDEYHPGVVVGVTLDGRIMVRWVGGRECAHGADRLLLDLSASADGERVDLLPWALRELHPDATTVSTGAVHAQYPEITMFGVGGYAVMMLAKSRRDWYASRTLAPWPDLTDLSDDDAARAVVVAALWVARG